MEDIENAKISLKKIDKAFSWAPVAYSCNPTYSGGRD
jgi:hypothetical protein